MVVHPPSRTGGRRVTARRQILGLAHSDRDEIEFLRRAGLPDGKQLLDDPWWPLGSVASGLGPRQRRCSVGSG
ncbi:hypothetical protein AB0C93_02415 [Streptomyces sp. NPDC048518]|uniref:hypothetical protein n=1 Tax=Streptomyces sp. NPDC048518 TaxID=3155029 RepID=UPI00340D4D3A